MTVLPVVSPPTPREERRRRRAATGIRPADRINRAALGLLGLILVGLGVAGLLAGGGGTGWTQPGRIYRDARADATAHPDLWTAGACLACLVLAAAGLWWAARQVSGRRHPAQLSGSVTITTSPRGSTTMQPSRAATAIAADLATLADVESVRTSVLALHPLCLVISAQVHRDTAHDPASMFDEPLARAARLFGVEETIAELRINFVDVAAKRRVA